MRENSRIHFIHPIPKSEEKVGIYCRVSTSSAEQLQSLTAQVSHLTRLVAAMPQWLLSDVYGYWQQVKQAHHAKSLIVCWRMLRLIN